MVNFFLIQCCSKGIFLEFVSRPEDVTAEEEQTVQIFCLTNDIEATYQWFKEDKLLLDGDIRNGLIISSSLTIYHVSETHSGTYGCVARNSRGQEVRASMKLTVTLHPSTPAAIFFLEHPLDTSLVQGKLVILPCRVNDPSAIITWYRDDILVNEGVFPGVFVDDRNRLLIVNTNFGHQGTYKCEAYNQEHAHIEARAHLAFPIQDIFSTQPANASVLVGEDLILECSTRNPELTVRWLKDGIPLVFNNRVFKLWDKVLLHNVNGSDAGLYTCIATDIELNQVASTSAQVTVMIHGLNGLECGTVTSPYVLNATEEPLTSSGRLVGGQEALRGSAPWMARLYLSGLGHLCGGSLIDRQWVITAAHCFHFGVPLVKEHLSIRLGDHSVLDKEQSEKWFQVDEIYQHEEFDSSTFNNDIALIKLVNPLATYNDYIRPICLADREKDRNLMGVGTIGRVNGWGRVLEGGSTASHLTEVNIPLKTFPACKKHFRLKALTFTKNMFCAGHPLGGIDACQGDSGGPYSIKDEVGRWYLTGIVSWGQGCGRKGQYGVYTRYSKYHDWIYATISRSM
ncbi:Coagulation factor IX [Holothuria leucospilota]|uniref:Coagulation factor IX n=1 Tax=Holothuria leucospilota TaxID=206669 RepID=A0A9Q1CNV3_HOLLE|nr:Coagulation factor IX [Holothuria leucospilota]